MEQHEIKQVIVEQILSIAPELSAEEIPEHGDLCEALDLDSMDFVRLISAIHQTLGVNIPESDYRQVRSLEGLITYLADR